MKHLHAMTDDPKEAELLRRFGELREEFIEYLNTEYRAGYSSEWASSEGHQYSTDDGRRLFVYIVYGQDPQNANSEPVSIECDLPWITAKLTHLPVVLSIRKTLRELRVIWSKQHLILRLQSSVIAEYDQL